MRERNEKETSGTEGDDTKVKTVIPVVSKIVLFSRIEMAEGGESHGHGREQQDGVLPIANISRIMKRIIPGNGKIAKEAKEAVQECVSEFISFITSEASEKCQRERRRTINGDDLLSAMAMLGFDDFINPLKMYLNRYREWEGDVKYNSVRMQPNPTSSLHYSTYPLAYHGINCYGNTQGVANFWTIPADPLPDRSEGMQPNPTSEGNMNIPANAANGFIRREGVQSNPTSHLAHQGSFPPEMSYGNFQGDAKIWGNDAFVPVKSEPTQTNPTREDDKKVWENAACASVKSEAMQQDHTSEGDTEIWTNGASVKSEGMQTDPTSEGDTKISVKREEMQLSPTSQFTHEGTSYNLSQVKREDPSP